ncbi:hypothetical protein niasHS_001236 [Heterodera schachtii]|uniref:Uncharacterized protein n=1 Tax=Heterodera schachtii TaxID=97005 RepID=A0ABD2KHU6_HETSC
MKLILQLNALFACFLSAKLLSCRLGLFGSVDKSYVHKELKNSSGVCHERGTNEAAFVKKYGSNYRCEQCQYGNENEDNGNANFAPHWPAPPPKPEIASTVPSPNHVNASVAPHPPNPKNSSVPLPPNPENGIDIVFSEMDIPLGVPPSAGSGRSTEPGIGQHFMMIFVAVALVGTAIRHGILL